MMPLYFRDRRQHTFEPRHEQSFLPPRSQLDEDFAAAQADADNTDISDFHH